ncbi:iron complex outermembrane receptor protein [Caulobacter rhizosphaerae]|uniref:Iron complex outermembrane receptor protein n=1 Tax=Caulobacter rhizosphaerae TaxID=2010972 RepID=A0ABU1MXZ3_9CAUL|nr:TonB-dependent receptor [Caulobacter rhizosphaerae]MDR6530700.1 iron complex outermembrane receptor protein [Caulobacter rhizosphaerae]
MKTMLKLALLAGAAWSAAATTAIAQDAAPAGADAASGQVAVDELVVTARRREETLKDVPIAVSAFSAETLERQAANDITTLSQTTPNITVQTARGSNSTLISYIRGIGQQDPLWGYEPGVGLYVDDVYVYRPQGAVLDVFDVSRIEVLRGPQGTLYGRNTIGGAIKYVTNRLGDEAGGKIRGTYGSYNQTDLLVEGHAPVGGGLSVGGAYALYKRDGYGANLTTGAEHYDKDVQAYRLSAEYKPNDDLFFRLAYDRVEDDSNPRHGHRELPALVGGYKVLDAYDTQAGLGDKNAVKTEGLSLTGEYHASEFLTFKSITAGRKGHTQTLIDFDGTPLPTLDVPATYDDRSFSQELQAVYSDDTVQGVFGLYYMNSQASGEFDTIAGNLGVSIADGGKVSTQSFAAFFDVSANFTDRFKVSLGARATRDHKRSNTFRFFYLGATRSPYQGGTPRPILQVRTNYSAEKTFEEFTPRLSASYELTDDLNTYVSYSKGYKSGGWDMRGDAFLTPQTVEGYDPETVNAYEVGLKGNLFDRRVSFATAAFLSKYKDQQVTTQVVVPSGIASSVDNAGASTLYGVEFEANARFSQHLSGTVAVGYIHAKYDTFSRFVPGGAPNPVNPSQTIPAGGQVVNVADLYGFQNTPEWTGNASLTWRGTVAGGELQVTPMVSYRDDYQQFEQPLPLLDQKAFTLVDLTASWAPEGGRYKISVAGKNLTDERYRTGGYNFGVATYNNSVIGFYGPPRTYSASIEVKF